MKTYAPTELADLLDRATTPRSLRADEDTYTRQMALAEDATRSHQLNVDSYVEWGDGVIARVHSDFVNHLFAFPAHVSLPDPADAVVTLNPRHGCIIISVREPGVVRPHAQGTSSKRKRVPWNALLIAQSLWGEDAPGSNGPAGTADIAGSPLDLRLGLSDLDDAIDATLEALGR